MEECIVTCSFLETLAGISNTNPTAAERFILEFPRFTPI